MGTYSMKYGEKENRLYIMLTGDFNYEEALNYQKKLMQYVKGSQIKTVLIDQANASFTPECMEIFEQNSLIPELKNAVTAMVLAPEVMNAISHQNHDTLQEGVLPPKPFETVEEASAYLSNL